MKKSNIERLQRQLIVHSFIYYRYNTSIWTDDKFDKAAYLLVDVKHTAAFKKSKFYGLFKDFDGSTGYHLLKAKPEGYWDVLAKDILSYQD